MVGARSTNRLSYSRSNATTFYLQPDCIARASRLRPQFSASLDVLRRAEGIDTRNGGCWESDRRTREARAQHLHFKLTATTHVALQADRDPREDDEVVQSDEEADEPSSVQREGSDDDGEDLMDNMEA